MGQLDVVRHYTHLSHRNFSVDANFYPLGSCTMKYNPKVNEWAAALPGFANLHPMQGEEDSQGALALLYHLRVFLQEIAGLDEVSLQPCAGAHGEWTALKVIRAYFKDHGQPKRRIVLAPDTAHGTNPASCAMCGAGVVTIKSRPDGLTDLDDLKAHLNDEVAAVMVTNPNTVGKFDAPHRRDGRPGARRRRVSVSRRREHERDPRHCPPGRFRGRCDALQHPQDLQHPPRLRRPGAGPIAVRKQFAPYLPVPQVIRTRSRIGRYSPGATLTTTAPRSIGKVRSFWGQFNVLVRAYAYIRACGPAGLRNVSRDPPSSPPTTLPSGSSTPTRSPTARRTASRWRPTRAPTSSSPSPRPMIDRGVTIMDIAKNLIDRGFHPPTVHWPVHDCLMIEPTETESKATLDAFADALLDIAEQSESDVDGLKQRR